MNELLLRYGILYFLLAAFLVARPWLSRKNVLFGVVFDSAEIWKQAESRRIIHRFLLACSAIGILLAAAFLVFYYFTSQNEVHLTQLYTVSIFALLLLEMIPYILANHKMKKLKAVLPSGNLVKGKITVEIGAANEIRPISAAWFLLLLLPIAVTIAFVILCYPELPEKVATHYSQSGAADAWEAKSIALVMGPVFHQSMMAALLFLVGFFSRMAPASVKGNPGAAPGYAAFRRIISLFVIAIAIVVETEFLLTELVYLGIIRRMQTAAAVITSLSILFIVLLFVAFFRMARGKKSSGAVLDDDDRWVLGSFYFNPSDPSLFVEKRNGIGRTINFGRPAAWILLAALILFIAIRVLSRR